MNSANLKKPPMESRDLESLAAEETLAWAFDSYSPKIALACSFQAEGSVLIDLIYRQRGSDFRVFT
ncbi:MAG TPA: hypothetical protein VNN13_04860, partial [Methylomirabilota bacterium]|nr:hypothetical protein [Methylomirabilota bacterium]